MRQVTGVLLILITAVVAIYFMRHREQYHTISGEVWTTEYHITFRAVSDAGIADSVAAVLAAVDRSVSAFNRESLLWRINSGECDTTDARFRRLFKASETVNRESDGAFDPTVMPLVNAWGFGYKSGVPPTTAQVDSIMEFVGLGKTRLEGTRIVRDDERTQFDFSSIAKGLACDEVGEMLRRNGVSSYLVEIGGEVVARGINKKGEPWHIAIDMPRDNGHETAIVVPISDMAVATSGNYRRFKESGGKRRSHIIDPKTGRSEESALLSVTVVAHDCMTADAWATACMAMGAAKAHALMDRRADLAVMTICAAADGNLVAWSNEAFAKLLP